MRPTPAAPFHRPGWIYEEKYDGWRVMAYKQGATVRLRSRHGIDCTGRFRELAAAIASVPTAALILDGEVAVFDEHLRSRLDFLRRPAPHALVTPPIYITFDCVYARGRDLRPYALGVRREVLETLIDGQQLLLAARRLPAHGLDAWAEVQRRGYEGLVAKDESSAYRGGLTRSWLGDGDGLADDEPRGAGPRIVMVNVNLRAREGRTERRHHRGESPGANPPGRGEANHA
jgi:bifunctional non-homologous end joining protein LigD